METTAHNNAYILRLSGLLAVALLLVSSLTKADTRDIESNKWHLLSMPGSGSFSALLENVSRSDINEVSIVTYDSIRNKFTQRATSDRINATDAFWFRQTTGQPMRLAFTTSDSQPMPRITVGCASENGCLEHDLYPSGSGSWTLVGVPFAQAVPIDQLRIITSGGACVDACTILEAKEALLTTGEFKARDAASGLDVINTAGDSLQPTAGYWFYTTLPKTITSARLLIPAPETSPAPNRSSLMVDVALIDDAMQFTVPSLPGSYASEIGNYGRDAPLALFLTLLAHDNPTIADSTGSPVMARALEHLRAAVSVEAHPLCGGGHAGWYDMFVPVALGIARRTPAMWEQLSTEEHQRADLLMRHCLHAANIFLNTNTSYSDRSYVFVDMKLKESGSLPNQSASFHAYGIGAYLYFGGAAGMTPVLAAYDANMFREQLTDAGFDDIAALYRDKRLQSLLNGTRISDRARPDPLGVRKPLLFLNTLSLERSAPGEEHPYFWSNPLPATPTGIFRRWGHDFAMGAMPQTKVGPSTGNPCVNGAEFGLATGTIPFEGEGKGMPYELNARSDQSGPHNRSSWDYSSWTVQQYRYLFAALSITGYWDENNIEHQEIVERARRANIIWRNIAINNWISSEGPAPQVCNPMPGNYDESFSGGHWAQGLMDGLFSSEYAFEFNPLVP